MPLSINRWGFLIENNVNKTTEQNGLKFDVSLGQTVDNLYAKAKVTNVSEDAIPYWGGDGCDRGFSASVFSKNEKGETIGGEKWVSVSMVCTAALWQNTLKPGKTIEIFEVLSYQRNLYMKIIIYNLYSRKEI